MKFPLIDPEHLISYDAPQLAIAEDGTVLAISLQWDIRTKNDPRAGWTMGSHYILHTIRKTAKGSK